MVYCGKPSKGCDHCRKKRLKVEAVPYMQHQGTSRGTLANKGKQCDQKLPGCGQCQNASRTCPGYRNQLDLMFRDESERVQQKYRMALIKDDADADQARNFSDRDSIPSSYPPSLDIAVSKEGTATVNTTQKIISLRNEPCSTYLGLGQPLSDVATSFFLAQYTPGSHFDYLPLLLSSSSTDSLLSTVFYAVSIASLGHESRSPELWTLAKQQYSRSLIETNKALQSSHISQQDGTLASILLLAHFETLTSEDLALGSDARPTTTHANSTPSEAWTRHVEGAIALVRLRPNPPLDSAVGVRLFRHVNATARYSCIQRRTRLPTELSSVRLGNSIGRDLEDPIRVFTVTVDSFIELRACMNEGSITDPIEIIQHALAIDEQTALISRGLPSSWNFDVVTTSRETVDVYKNKYHLYPSHHAAQLWNEIRMTRLALNEIMYHYSAATSRMHDADVEHWTSQRSRYVRTIEQMATEICQSTTEFLRKATSSSLPRDGAAVPKRTLACVYLLIWPLFSAASASLVASQSICEFVIDRLHFIGMEMKIPQARKAALMLEQGVMHEDWLHMLHLF